MRSKIVGATAVALLVMSGLASSQTKNEPTAGQKALADVCARGVAKAEETRAALGADKGPEDVARWSLRLVAATRDLGDPAKTREVLKAHLERTKKFEEWTKNAHKAGAASELDVLESEFRRTEAEAWAEQQGGK